MKKKKGFTLIELLAVIVILAIVALIAVPVIMNVLNKANKSALKDTAYGIISAGELYFAEQQLDLNGMSSDATFTFPNDIGTLEVKGQVPDGTVLKVNTQGKVALAMQNGRYCITKGYSDTDVTVSEDVENCNIPSGEGNTGGTTEKTLTELAVDNFSVSNVGDPEPTIVTKPLCLTDGTTCEPGTPVAIKVNNDKTYRFYVIEEKDNKVTLIMDRNLGDKKAWASEVDYGCKGEYCALNDKGPITILNYLTSQVNSETESWSNIPAIESYEYKNNPDATGAAKVCGYQKLVITNGTGVLTSTDGSTTALTGTMRARLLTEEEVNTIKTNNSGTIPTWLKYNLSISNTTDAPYGYWLLTAHPSRSNNGLSMYYDGTVYRYTVYNETDNGARPVIELSK